ncbi:nuclear pore membrane glycoprotein 210-like [Drosophila miranda]|uniref:nuclear pore membrane glycoprotein 210-like n=1 Tax=Drosophila miranda TaxID=7229 RepID=UPI00143F460E|nr:nuclear pore membrane glycoprotein 210-like [Drosophila miranda]
MAACDLYFVFLIFAAHKLTNAVKLNQPRVLLPIFNDKPVNLTLEVDERNCYKWTSSRQDLISVQPVYHVFSECAYEAVVTVRTRERRRNTAIVFAEEVQTGAMLRCDVIVDKISSLNVRTATRQLYLEEAPSTLRATSSSPSRESSSTGTSRSMTARSRPQCGSSPSRKAPTTLCPPPSRSSKPLASRAT